MSRDHPLRAERDGEVVTIGEDRVAIGFDPDREAWRVTGSSVPGLTAEADSRDGLVDLLPALIRQARMP